jgi:hypothetical protein
MLLVINEYCGLSRHLGMLLDREHSAKRLLVLIGKNEDINLLLRSRSFHMSINTVSRRQASWALVTHG